MTIKKLTAKEISIDTQSVIVKISHLDSFKVTIGDSIIEKPGEYEINNIYLTNLEVPNPDFQQVTDFVSIRSEGIDVGVLMSDKGTNKDYLKDVANIDILVLSSDIDPENVKKMLVLFEPQYLLILSYKDLETLKKDYNLPAIVEDKSLKVKDSDFPRGENIVVRPIVLK